MKLFVLRHGEVDVNVKNQINSINNSTLTEKGINQVEKSATKLSNYDIDLIICSPLRRTKETCEHVNKKGICVEYDDRLMERDSKSMQYHSVNDIDWTLWYDTSKEIIYTDTEGFKSVLKRVNEFLNEINNKYSDKNILLITHGDICKAINAIINDIDSNKEIVKFDQKNAEVVEYKIENTFRK